MQEKVSSTVETFERKPSLLAAFPAALPLLCVLCALPGSFHRPASTADYDPLVNTASAARIQQSNILRSNFNALTPRLCVSAAAQETSGRGRRLKFWGKQKTTCCAKPMSHLN